VLSFELKSSLVCVGVLRFVSCGNNHLKEKTVVFKLIIGSLERG
jgi:hypothetical protein